MPLNRKERTQVILLIALLVVIIGAVGYYYRGSLLPRSAVSAKGYTSPVHLMLPAVTQDMGLFQREDFKKLRQFGDVPVKAVQLGPNDPFK